jgi:hypothetical protein
MRVRSEAFHLWKAGNAPDEYEDACWPEGGNVRDVRAFRCAVADGATETSFAASWARSLVRSYCRGDLSPRRMSSRLPLLRAQWRREAFALPLPWYAEEKALSGAFSSILGVSLQATEEGISWQAMAIGDTCLFQIRGDELIVAFPLADSRAFNSRPHLLSSNVSALPTGGGSVARREGVAQTGDTFLLMTDALACWFLAEHETGQRPWNGLRCSASFGGEAFEDWIGRLREEKVLRNDDVTLLRVQLV